MRKVLRHLEKGVRLNDHIKNLQPEKFQSVKKLQKLLQKEQLPDWNYDEENDCLKKSFEFQNFKESFSYMQSVANFAEEINHHPEWFNVYNKVDVQLRTHDCDGVSAKDMFMAKYMNMVEQRVKEEQPDKFKTYKISQTTFKVFKRNFYSKEDANEQD